MPPMNLGCGQRHRQADVTGSRGTESWKVTVPEGMEMAPQHAPLRGRRTPAARGRDPIPGKLA